MSKHLIFTLCGLSTLHLCFLLSCAATGSGPDIDVSAFSLDESLPPYSPRFDREKPIVAVVAENRFTELTDFVIPYGILAESAVADVVALSTMDGPVRMFPALRIEAQSTIDAFDRDFPRGADYVIVPAVHYSDDPSLLTWVRAQAKKGATLVGVCDGVWVLANAGLLENRKAVGHWYSFKRLENQFQETQWIRNRRYVSDGNVVTTTGVTASIPVSLAIVEAIAGHETAETVATSMGVTDWSANHRSDDFRLSARHILTAIRNWTSFWAHDEIAIPITTGVDEISLALVADTHSRTYRSSAFTVASSLAPIPTRRGLTLLPDKTEARAGGLDRRVELVAGVPPIVALDSALQEIEERYGRATADFVALQTEYRRDPPTD